MNHNFHLTHTPVGSADKSPINDHSAPAIENPGAPRPCRFSIYRVLKWTLTALGMVFASQQLTNLSGNRNPGLQSRNVSHLLEPDISTWLSPPMYEPDDLHPTPDFFLPDNDSRYFSTCPAGYASEQETIDDLLPDLKHLFDESPAEPTLKKTSDKDHHRRIPKEQNLLDERDGQLPPPNHFETSHEYTSQKSLQASVLQLLPNPPSPTTVAVIDGGFIPHKAFQDGLLLPGYDFIKDAECAGDGDGYDNDPTEVLNHQSKKDSPWHGTAVTGIIAGTFKSYALELQKNIKILPIRLLTSSCSGTDEDLINALKWAAGMPVADVPLNPNPAKIINLAFGHRSSDCSNLLSIFHELYERDITVIACAGNEATPAHWFLFANCPEVIIIGTQFTELHLARSSNYGPPIALSAVVGLGLKTTSNTGNTFPLEDVFAKLKGTSAAAALVSHASALMLSVNGRLTPDDIRTILINTSRPFQSTQDLERGEWCTNWLNTTDNSTFSTCSKISDPDFTTRFSFFTNRQCTRDICGAGHLDIAKAVAAAAAGVKDKDVVEPDDRKTCDYQWENVFLV